ncbi:MAG TPA: TIGR02996 domain-containing protein, partial [Kofleriaceae bacterium]|nr:TIGR02996 domain-containing protein [Kofleriaceae bacterium]
MDAVAARKLLAELVKSEQLEVRRVDPLAKDLAAFVNELGRPPSGRELDDWLDGQPMVTESYASEAVLEDLLARHLAPPPVTVEAPEARHPELERAIAEAPETVEPYQVYSDFLQEAGDPFGELIALGIAGEGERVERLRQQGFARWFGTLTKEHVRRVQLHWKHGVVAAIEETVEHGVLGPYEWTALLQARACGFVRAIKLLQPCTAELDAVLAEHAAPT